MENPIKDSDIVLLSQSNLFELNIWVLWTLFDGVYYYQFVIIKMAFYHWKDALAYGAITYDEDGTLDCTITWKTLV